MGEDGAKRVVVNSVGREIRTLDEDPPTEGKRLQLTIDYDVQKAIEDGFKVVGLQRRGGGARSEQRRRARVHQRAGLRPERVRGRHRSRDLGVAQHRRAAAAAGSRDPGTLFARARRSRWRSRWPALEEGIITPDFHAHCAGHANFYGRDFKCWKKGGHGSIDLRHAIEQSCDVYFYTVGNMVGVDKINKWATLLGLGVKSGIDLPNEVQGLVPSTEWKREKMHEKWYAGETISVVDRPGPVSLTPVSMAVYMATLANGGTRVTPHLLKAVDDGSGWKPVPPPPPQSKIDVDPEKLQAIRDGLWMVVNAAGTGGRARLVGYDVSGKTGTAQVISNTGRVGRGQDRQRTCATTAGSCSSRRATIRRLPASCSLEHGIHGGNAARITHHILETFFAKQEGRPLPPAPTDFNLNFSDPLRASQPAPAARRAELTPCSNDASTTTSTGRWSVAILALCALGVVMINSTTADPTRAMSRMYITQLYAIVLGLVAMVFMLTLDYRTFTDKSHLIYIGLLRAADLRDVLRHGADGRAPLDSAQGLQPAAVGIRQGRRRAGARQVLRREPRRAVVDRPRDRRAR